MSSQAFCAKLSESSTSIFPTTQHHSLIMTPVPAFCCYDGALLESKAARRLCLSTTNRLGEDLIDILSRGVDDSRLKTAPVADDLKSAKIYGMKSKAP